jgi:2,4-dienoyl-CoA reductase-like NADH-dependent reductase (Old Yellow Enzyme family)
LPVRELAIADIHEVHRDYAEAARRAHAAGFEWLEMHFAHGYLGSAFFSPLANQRSDAYGGTLEKRLRFHREALDAVRAVWPSHLPLTMRLGCDDFNAKGIQFEDALWAISELKQHGLDFADISLGMNTDDMKDVPFDQIGFMVQHAARVRRECGLPVGVSWNLGVPEAANRVIRDGLADIVLLGRPALSNPHWPVYAARELGHADPFSLLPEDWAWWIRTRPGPEGSLGWPLPSKRPAAS